MKINAEKAKTNNWLWPTVGGLVIGGSVAMISLPVVGLIAAVAGAVGIATRTKETSERLARSAQILDDLATSASSALAKVMELNTSFDRVLRSIDIADMSLEQARAGRGTNDLLAALERIRTDSDLLYDAVHTAEFELNKIKTALRSYVDNRANASK